MMRTRLLAAILLAGLLPACGSDSSSGPTPVPTPAPTPAPPQVVLSGSRALPAGFATGAAFNTDRAGTLEATVDYTFASSSIAVLIARGNCTAELFAAEQCLFAATSLSGPKPRVVTLTSAAAGTYTLIVGNLSDVDEAISVQVVLIPSAADAGRVRAASPPSAWLSPAAREEVRSPAGAPSPATSR
jgi:hypothetical protein